MLAIGNGNSQRILSQLFVDASCVFRLGLKASNLNLDFVINVLFMS